MNAILSKFEEFFFNKAAHQSCIEALREQNKAAHRSLRKRIADMEASLDGESEWFLERREKKNVAD